MITVFSIQKFSLCSKLKPKLSERNWFTLSFNTMNLVNKQLTLQTVHRQKNVLMLTNVWLLFITISTCLQCN